MIVSISPRETPPYLAQITPSPKKYTKIYNTYVYLDLLVFFSLSLFSSWARLSRAGRGRVGGCSRARFRSSYGASGPYRASASEDLTSQWRGLSDPRATTLHYRLPRGHVVRCTLAHRTKCRACPHHQPVDAAAAPSIPCALVSGGEWVGGGLRCCCCCWERSAPSTRRITESYRELARPNPRERGVSERGRVRDLSAVIAVSYLLRASFSPSLLGVGGGKCGPLWLWLCLSVYSASFCACVWVFVCSYFSSPV